MIDLPELTQVAPGQEAANGLQVPLVEGVVELPFVVPFTAGVPEGLGAAEDCWAETEEPIKKRLRAAEMN